jgi:hypothetical protein
MESRAKFLLFSILFFAIIGVGVWILSSEEEEGTGLFIPKVEDDAGSQMSSTTDPTLEEIPDMDNLNEPLPELGDGVTPKMILERYVEWAQYPPYSRPLSEGNYDLIHPFQVPLASIPMIDTLGSKEPNGYRCLFQPENTIIVGGADAHITLECRDKSMATTKLRVDSIQAFKEFEGKKTGVLSPDYNDDGRDGDKVRGDGVFTLRWKPRREDWGSINFIAKITYGEEGKKGEMQTTIFSSPNKPLEFTGVFNDRIDNGSLKVSAVVQVFKKGKYHLEANLKDEENGDWIGYSTFDGDLNQGNQEVPFIFFGKLLRDKNLDGPYIMTTLRGYRVNLPIDPDWLTQGEEGMKKIMAAKTTEPDKEYVIPYKDEHKTRKFKVEEFSKDAWNSEDKLNRIKMLSNLK